MQSYSFLGVCDRLCGCSVLMTAAGAAVSLTAAEAGTGLTPVQQVPLLPLAATCGNCLSVGRWWVGCWPALQCAWGVGLSLELLPPPRTQNERRREQTQTQAEAWAPQLARDGACSFTGAAKFG